MPLKKGRGKGKGVENERGKKAKQTKEKDTILCFFSTHSSNLILHKSCVRR